MPEITVRMGSATTNVTDEQREAIEQLAADLSEHGHSAHVETVERIPGRYGVTFSEQVVIFVASGASTALIANVVNDVYGMAKEWGRKRFGKRKEASETGRARPLTISMYGPDDELLLTWKIDSEGEHENRPSKPPETQD